MRPAIVDTDILSAFFRAEPSVVSSFTEYYNIYGAINLSIISYYEIKSGLLYKDAKKQLSRFQDFVKENNVVILNIPSVDFASKIEADLRLKGEPIGHTDVLIAGIAMANDFQLITNNTNDFSRIKDLSIGNWLSK